MMIKKRSFVTSLVLATSVGSVYAEDVSLESVKVVSAKGFMQNITDAPATMTVITNEELQKKSYTDIADALKNVPGVFIDGGGANQSILMRGMGSAYTLFLIDGKPMQNADAFTPNGNLAGVQMNFLPSVENIERIEIIRGPASSLYGSDAMGGVINIITKKAVEKVSAGISYEYLANDPSNRVNNDAMNTNIYMNAPLIEKLLYVSLNGSYNYTEESSYIANNTESAGSDPEYKKENLGVKFTLTPNEKNTLTLGYYYNKQLRDYTVGNSLDETQSDRNYTSYKENYYLTHEYKDDQLLLSSYINYDDAQNPSRSNATTGNAIASDTLMVNTQGTLFFDSHIATLGFRYTDERLEDGATNALHDEMTKMQAYQYAFFAEDEWFLLDDFSLSLGARYDKNELFGGNISPKVYGIYKATDTVTLKAGVTTGYKTYS